MSRRKKEAERPFADALRAQAFTLKAAPDYKAIALARKVERRWMRFAWLLGAVMCAAILWDCLRVV